jgi:ABC-type branched-subunit amino acid transport system ATPase component
VIELARVTKVFQGKRTVTALAEVDLSIGRGEMESIVGPSGLGCEQSWRMRDTPSIRERIAMVLAQKIAVLPANPTVARGGAPVLSERLRILAAQPASRAVLPHHSIHSALRYSF